MKLIQRYITEHNCCLHKLVKHNSTQHSASCKLVSTQLLFDFYFYMPFKIHNCTTYHGTSSSLATDWLLAVCEHVFTRRKKKLLGHVVLAGWSRDTQSRVIDISVSLMWKSVMIFVPDRLLDLTIDSWAWKWIENACRKYRSNIRILVTHY